MYFLFKILAVLLFLLNPWAQAVAQLQLELQLRDTTLFLGDEITLQLKVDGTQKNATLKLPDVEGLQFRQLGAPSASTQTIIVNGKVNSFSGLVYTIGISAERTGSFAVPGFEVEHEAKTYRSEGFRITVKEPGQQSNMKLVTEVSSTTPYWQEPITLTLKWYVQEEVEDYAFRFPLLRQKEELNLRLKEPAVSGTATDITVESYKIPFIRSEETVAGEPFTVYQVDLTIVPPTSGSFKIPAASVKAVIREGTELKQDFFGRMVRAPKLKQIFAASPPLSIDIQPLPEENRPPTFTGAVGRFRIDTSIENTQVKVGDPVELTIKISGEGRLENIEAPILAENPGFSEHFSFKENLQPGDIQAGSILFKQVIRPRHERVNEVPSVSFSFFNPLQQAYQTVQSRPLPIKVLPTGRVTKEDVVLPEEQQELEVQSFTKRGKGLYANYSFEDALVSQTGNWHWILWLFCPPAVYALVLVAARRSRKMQNDKSLARASTAKRKSSKRLRAAEKLLDAEGDDFFLELSQALRGYVADKFNLGAGQVTAFDMRQLEEKKLLPQSLTVRVVELLDELDRLRFTGVTIPRSDRETLLNRVAVLMRELEKQI